MASMTMMMRAFGTSSGRRATSKFALLDMRGSGASILERLVLEEALLRHDPLKRCWAIVGTHHPTASRWLANEKNDDDDDDDDERTTTDDCAVVLGIGGKPKELLDLEAVRRDGVTCVRRFSGGGTVVVDESSLFTTLIGRTDDLPHVEPYPRDIMRWSADEVFSKVFERMNDDLRRRRGTTTTKKMPKSLVVESKSCGVTDASSMRSSPLRSSSSSSSSPPPVFSLRENDYVLGDHKMGGNAQSIVKGGWLHHTSFLWDYETRKMAYLTLPAKRPDYRADRPHKDFLVKLRDHYGDVNNDDGEHEHDHDVVGPDAFLDSVAAVARESFDAEDVALEEALDVVVNAELGGMRAWFDGKCRTRLVDV